jgi:hypothetical protein
MKAYMMPQTSDEWWSIRRAIPTASCFDKIITAKEGRLSKSYPKYIAELLSQAAMPDASYFARDGVWRGTQAMQDGNETEPQARKWYTMETGNRVQMVGFCLADSEEYGCSPDGAIGLVQHELADTIEGTLELKCPMLKTQFEYLLEQTLPIEYRVQVHGQLAVTGAQWCDFVSYHLDAPGLIVRVEPDDFTKQVKEAVEEFVDKLTAEAKRLGVILRKEKVAA